MTRILQISDTHLFADRDEALVGIPTYPSLQLIVDDVRRRAADAEVCLLTGDLSQDTSAQSYRHLIELLAPLEMEKHALPGNHDDRDAMRRVLEPADIGVNRGFDCAGWRIIMLDSLVPGSEHGMLSAQELARLEGDLSAHRDTPCLLAVHHPAVALGSDWIDGMRLHNSEELFAVLDRHPQVRALIWGHAHQNFQGRHNDITLIGTPSTCVQFLPGSLDYATDSAHPGYRVLDLHSDGSLDTEVLRLVEFPYQVDPSSNGYGMVFPQEAEPWEAN